MNWVNSLIFLLYKIINLSFQFTGLFKLIKSCVEIYQTNKLKKIIS